MTRAREDASDPVQWCLQVCMANAGIRFASDLHRRLVARIGEDLAPSESQVSRLVRHRPERLNLTVLGGLCQVLDCEPGDLLRLAERGRMNGGRCG
ncbi:MAG: helix-turn-helix domain-containing protein [Cumulibacter sp.]